MRKTRKSLVRIWSSLAIVLLFVPLAWSQSPESTDDVRLVAYRSFRPKFHNETESFSLVANYYIVNVGRRSLKEVTFRQPFPEDLTLRASSELSRSRAESQSGFWEKIEGNTYIMHEPEIRRRRGATLLAELDLKRRTGAMTLPPIEFDYQSTGGEGTKETIPMELDVSDYANHVGDLDRFLRKFADISLDPTASGRDGWEFYPRAAVAVGRNPEGIAGIETADEGYTGYFRLHNGTAGDALDILVRWKQTWKEDIVQDETQAKEELSEYLKWMGPFKLDLESTSLSQEKKIARKYKGFVLEGRWIDTVPKQLGSGPLKAMVFFSPREDVEYYVVLRAHGRAVGTDSAKPEPEKEAALMALHEKIWKTFKSEISPLSHNR